MSEEKPKEEEQPRKGKVIKVEIKEEPVELTENLS